MLLVLRETTDRFPKLDSVGKMAEPQSDFVKKSIFFLVFLLVSAGAVRVAAAEATSTLIGSAAEATQPHMTHVNL